MKLNKKGFTLIELLGVITILALVIGISSFAIVSAIKASKAKALDVTLSSILDSAETYSLEQGDTAWHTTETDNYSYYCVTIEELINKGLIASDKKTTKQFNENNISITNYIILKKNKVTKDIIGGNKDDIIDNNYQDSDAFKKCNGSVNSENLVSPRIKGKKEYTDTITIDYDEGKIETDIDPTIPVPSTVTHFCYYGLNSNNINNKVPSNINGKCNITGLEDNTDYYVKVCIEDASDESAKRACSATISSSTLEVQAPIITKEGRQGAKVKYNDTGITGPSYHYLKSDKKGTTASNVKECTYNNSNNKYECSDANTTEIKANTWYLVPVTEINISYPNGTGKVIITAETRDKSNNTGKATKTIDIYDIYTANFYKNDAKLIGGMNTNKLTRTCESSNEAECKIMSPSITAQTGLKVVGWNTNQNASTSELSPDSRVILTSDVDYYAITTERETYTVEYNANGGTGAPTSQTKTPNVSLRLKSDTPTRIGYKFLCWNTKSDGTGTDYNPGAYYKENSSITLYAKWQVNTVTIQFNTNGGTITENTSGGTWTTDSAGLIYKKGTVYTQTVNYGSSMDTNGLANYSNKDYINITKTGYSAPSGAEWKCLSGNCKQTTYNQQGAIAASNLCDASKENCTVTLGVNWKENLTITYNANGGSGAPASQVKEYGKNATLSSTKPTRPGYTFKGWNTKSDGTGTNYASGATYTGNSSITLYAKWQINTVTIKFNTGGGTITPSTTDNGITRNWKIDGSGLINKKEPNESTYTIYTRTLNYGYYLGSGGLADYNNPKYVEIKRTNYTGVSGAEWKCLSGCTVSNKTFNQAKDYKASDFCDATNKDCTVTLGVNWKEVSTNVDAQKYNCSSYGGTYRLRVLHVTTCNNTTCAFDLLNGLTKGSSALTNDVSNPNTSNWTIDKNNLSDRPSDNCAKTYYVNASGGLNCREGASTSSDIVRAYGNCSKATFYRTTTKYNTTNGDNWWYSYDNDCYVAGTYIQTANPCSSSGGGSSGGGGGSGSSDGCTCSSSSDCKNATLGSGTCRNNLCYYPSNRNDGIEISCW